MVNKTRYEIQGTPLSLALSLQREAPSLRSLEQALGNLRTAVETQPNFGIPPVLRSRMYGSLSRLSEAVVQYLERVLADDSGSVGVTLVHGEELTPLYSTSGTGTDSTALQTSVMYAATAQQPNFIPLQGGFGIHLDTSLDALTPNQRRSLLKVLPSVEKALLETATSLERPEDTETLEDLVTIPRRELEDLQRHATTDRLTGLLNRVGYEVCLNRELAELMRQSGDTPCSYLMVDIDNFKPANDSYGHLKGDEILAAVGEVVRRSVRGHDIAYRFGGEELVVVLPGANSVIAHSIAERLRTAVHECISVPVGTDTAYQPTVSIGVATASVPERNLDAARETITQLAHEADAALYEAKRTGRNKVVVYEAGMQRAATESRREPTPTFQRSHEITV